MSAKIQRSGPLSLLGTRPKYEARLVLGGVVVRVTPPALLGLESVYVELTTDQYDRFVHWIKTGVLIQDVLADLSANEREKLLTGIEA